MNASGPAPAQPAASALDRRVPLASLLARTAPWLVLLGVALAVRLYGLRTFPLGPHEATLASDAAAIVDGGDLSRTGWAQPLPTVLGALSFFLFGPGDGAARLPSLVAGLALLVTFAALGRRVGQPVALAAATLLALSPTAIVASTRADGAILLALLALVAATLSTSDASPARATLLGAAVAGAALAHPLGWFVVTGVVLVAAVRTRPRAAFWVPFAAGTLVTLGLTSSLLFTRPAGFAAFLAASWSSLRHDYLAPVGTAWHRPLVLLATDEFPVLVAGITGAVLAVRGRVDRWHLWLSLAVLVLAAALGGGSLAASTAVTLAVGITGAFGLAASIAAVPWTSLLDRWNAATTGAVALTVFVALSLIGRLFGGPAGDTVAWLTGLVSLVLLLLVALWVVRSLWPYASAGRWIPLVLVLLALATLASRNAMLANATTSYRPGTLLHASDASPGLVVAVDRLRRASTDLTMFQFDPRDPTGGHGLIVVVADEIGQPFAWYLRDFPNLQRVPSDRLDQAVASAQVVIVTAADQARVAALRPDLVWQPVPYRLEPPASLAAPDWRRLVLSLVDPRDWRAYVSFLLYRRVSVPTPPESILVGLSPEVAARAGYPAVP